MAVNGQAVAVQEAGAIDAARVSSGLALSFGEMALRVRQLDEFYRDVMQDGTDYGVIPGTGKPSLYQPGAQLLDQIFGLVPCFEVDASSVIDWQRPIPFFHYVVRCRLLSRRTGELVAEAIGSCNTHEDRYRWRKAARSCPSCGAEAIIKGKAEYGGGWLCFKRNGGCGAKYSDGDQAIEGQQAGRVENEDTASLENTVLKMAQKRAHVAATLNATGASRIFTQDVEDLPQFQGRVIDASSEPASAQGPAGPRARASFERSWQRGVEQARAVGVSVGNMPPQNATADDLRAALAKLKADIEAAEQPATTDPIAADGPRSYDEVFPGDEPAPPAEPEQPIQLPAFDHEASFTKPQLVELYGTWSALLQQLDPSYTPTWAGNGPQRVSFGDLDDAVRDLVTRASEIHAERYGQPDEGEAF